MTSNNATRPPVTGPECACLPPNRVGPAVCAPEPPPVRPIHPGLSEKGSNSMEPPERIRTEANTIKVRYRMVFAVGPRQCACGSRWPCPEWKQAEKLARQAQDLENSA